MHPALQYIRTTDILHEIFLYAYRKIIRDKNTAQNRRKR